MGIAPDVFPRSDPVSIFLRHYLGLGLSDIVSVHYKSREEAGGYADEHTDETVIARRGDHFVKVSVRCHTRFAPNRGGSEYDVGAATSITEEEYTRSADGKSIIDTPKARAEIVAEDKTNRRREDLREQLNATAPQCPKCQGAMQERSGKNGAFWGCQSFPKCKGTSNFSVQTKKLYAELSRT